MSTILAFAGSSRKASFNKKLASAAADAARRAGAEVTLIDLADYDMPIFNGDLEASDGMPGNAQRFKQLLLNHDGILVSSPEYNGAFSPLLKNALDWASRSEQQGEPPLSAYKGKVAAIMSASTGGGGGLRGLVHLRMLLNNLGVLVLPHQQAVANASQAFDEDGQVRDAKTRLQVDTLAAGLVSTLDKLCRRQDSP